MRELGPRIFAERVGDIVPNFVYEPKIAAAHDHFDLEIETVNTELYIFGLAEPEVINNSKEEREGSFERRWFKACDLENNKILGKKDEVDFNKFLSGKILEAAREVQKKMTFSPQKHEFMIGF